MEEMGRQLKKKEMVRVGILKTALADEEAKQIVKECRTNRGIIG